MYITNTTLTKGVVKLTKPETEINNIPWQKITIHATEEKLNSRVILVFVKREEKLMESALTVRLIGGGYTPEYIALTKNYHHTDLAAGN
jgi:hypothetical protein